MSSFGNASGQRKRAHGNVVRRPWTDARKRHQTLDGVLRLVMGRGVQVDRTIDLAPGQGNQAAGTSLHEAVTSDGVDTGGRDPLGSRRQPAQRIERRRNRFAEGLHETAGHRLRGLDADLLPDDRSQAQLEPVERPWHSHATVRRHRGTDVSIPGQMPGDDVWSGIEIEQRPNPPQQARQHWRQALGEFDHQCARRPRMCDHDPTRDPAQLHRA